jgi:hypothetical protein
MNKEDLDAFILETISKTLNKPVKREDCYTDLGGESIELQDILGIINRTYKVKILVKEVIRLQYIDEIIEYISLKIINSSSQ